MHISDDITCTLSFESISTYDLAVIIHFRDTLPHITEPLSITSSHKNCNTERFCDARGGL